MTILPSVNKTGKITSYEIRVYNGYDENGKRRPPFVKRWKPPAGMSENQIKKEVKRVATKFEADCLNGKVSHYNGSLSELAEEYLEEMESELSPRTLDEYRRISRDTILPALGKLKVTDIRRFHVQKFVDDLKKEPALNNGVPFKDGRKISPATVKRKLAVLQSMLSFALKRGYITINYAESRYLKLPKQQHAQTEVFTPDEAKDIVIRLNNESLQFRTMIHLAIITGMREGELVGLKFSDINFNDEKITISRSAYKLKGEPIKTKVPKSNRSRVVSISSSCTALLTELQQQHKEAAEKLGTKWAGDDWVFTQWDGSILHPQTPSQQFRKFLENNGIPHRKFHSLRHTSATLLLYNGTDLKTVQARLGHADFKTTMDYLHLVEQADKNAAISMDKLLLNE